jgi:hypothetical protein
MSEIAPARAWSQTVAVAIGTTLANLFGYAFNAIMSRELGVGGYGELGSLLAVIVVASVPGTALQAVLARRLRAGGDAIHPVKTTLAVAAAVAAAVALMSPALHAFLGIGSYLPVLWTAASLLPTTVAFGWQGMLQGAGRYVELAGLPIAVQPARIGGAVVAAETGTRSSGALAVGAALTAGVVLAAAPLVLAGLPSTARRVHRDVLGDTLRDVSPILGVLVLSNLDLLLARHFLDHHASGLYAAGNLVTRAAFWGPAFVVLTVYPQLAVPEQRDRALRRGALTLVVIGALGILASLVAAQIVPLLLGKGYDAITGRVWLFAAEGLALVGTQFAVYAGLAVSDRRLGRLVWLAVVAECILVAAVAHRSIAEIVTVALCCVVTLLAAAVTIELRR